MLHGNVYTKIIVSSGMLKDLRCLALGCTGQPHLGVDVDQVEPPAVVAAAAAALFASGKPLTGSRSLPKINLDEQYDNVAASGASLPR